QMLEILVYYTMKCGKWDIPLPDDSKRLNYVHLYQGKVGTVFEGKAEMNLTIGELLRKEAKF
ncbi:hypothetical protein KBT16_05880, partial [Nostoc sp. CCCryo 231-06]|nr:hypothetical protein [Nostoc sp. CCCryo 231-06]